MKWTSLYFSYLFSCNKIYNTCQSYCMTVSKNNMWASHSLDRFCVRPYSKLGPEFQVTVPHSMPFVTTNCFKLVSLAQRPENIKLLGSPAMLKQCPSRPQSNILLLISSSFRPWRSLWRCYSSLHHSFCMVTNPTRMSRPTPCPLSSQAGYPSIKEVHQY